MTKKKWPKYLSFYKIWHQFSEYEKLPDCSLINVYPDHNSKLGLHQDKDENVLKLPYFQFLLGCTAIFNYGKDKKKLQKTTIWLYSGFKRSLQTLLSLYQKLFLKKILWRKNKSPLSKYKWRISVTLRRFSK